MSAVPKAVRVDLPCVDVRGFRVTEISVGVVQVNNVPPSPLGVLLKMKVGARRGSTCLFAGRPGSHSACQSVLRVEALQSETLHAVNRQA